MYDPFKSPRDSLAVARVELGPTHAAFAKRVEKLEARLTPPSATSPNPDYDGDPGTVPTDIRKIVGELVNQTEIRKGSDTDTGKKMKQSGKPVLPPNVAAAIGRLESALAELERGGI